MSDPSLQPNFLLVARDKGSLIRSLGVQNVAGTVIEDLGELFEREGDRVFGFLLARCGSRAVAEDLTAETFLSAGRRFTEGKSHEVSTGWLITVARRRLIDHWRNLGAQRRRFERLTAELERHPPPDDQLPTRVDEALASLSEQYRAALALRYLDDFSVSEVADALGKSYKATESLLGRARQAFATAYEIEQC
jgi:RNA polymerase sigma-70 factor (ECF subfamily)